MHIFQRGSANTSCACKCFCFCRRDAAASENFRINFFVAFQTFFSLSVFCNRFSPYSHSFFYVGRFFFFSVEFNRVDGWTFCRMHFHFGVVICRHIWARIHMDKIHRRTTGMHSVTETMMLFGAEHEAGGCSHACAFCVHDGVQCSRWHHICHKYWGVAEWATVTQTHSISGVSGQQQQHR